MRNVILSLIRGDTLRRVHIVGGHMFVICLQYIVRRNQLSNYKPVGSMKTMPFDLYASLSIKFVLRFICHQWSVVLQMIFLDMVNHMTYYMD